jgi:hypothetical protein
LRWWRRAWFGVCGEGGRDGVEKFESFVESGVDVVV